MCAHLSSSWFLFKTATLVSILETGTSLGFLACNKKLFFEFRLVGVWILRATRLCRAVLLAPDPWHWSARNGHNPQKSVNLEQMHVPTVNSKVPQPRIVCNAAVGACETATREACDVGKTALSTALVREDKLDLVRSH